MLREITVVLLATFAGAPALAQTYQRQGDPSFDVSTAASRVTTVPFMIRIDHPFVTFVPSVGGGTSQQSSVGMQASALLELGAGSYFFQTGGMYLREAGQASTGLPLLAKVNFDLDYRRYTVKAGVIPTLAMSVYGMAAIGLEFPNRAGNDLRFELSYDREVIPQNQAVPVQSLLASVGFGLGIF